MKIALWRVGAGLQTDHDSVVGGGKIARRIITILRDLGHEVTVCGRVGKQTAMWLQDNWISHAPEIGVREFDGICMLTGPFNPMYDAVATTYERLARFEGRVVYAWWDTALPFEFAPQKSALFRKKSNVTTNDLTRNKSWRVLSQIRPASMPDVSDWVRCFWELAEVDGAPLAPEKKADPVVGYFGSPRPDRIRELQKLFAGNRVPLRVGGKWSPADLGQLKECAVEFVGALPEGAVREALHRCAATIHLADKKYVKQDYIAQRFFENAMAGVATAFSAHIQPSTRSVVEDAWLVRDADEVAAWWHNLAGVREALARTQQEKILGWARANAFAPAEALKCALA